ncbi:MAG: hypothetical protein WAV90_03810, partial [Gordonia amarae]
MVVTSSADAPAVRAAVQVFGRQPEHVRHVAQIRVVDGDAVRRAGCDSAQGSEAPPNANSRCGVEFGGGSAAEAAVRGVARVCR